MIQSSVSLWLVPTTRAQAMSAPDDEVDGVRSCFHAGREPTSWFCIRRSTPRQPESWHNKASRAVGGHLGHTRAKRRTHARTDADKREHPTRKYTLPYASNRVIYPISTSKAT